MSNSARQLKLPLILMLVVAILVGVAWGLKIQKNTAKRKAPEADATTLKVLALKNAFPPAVIKVFEGQANIKVQLTEEPTPEALWAKLEQDSSFDVATLLNHQTQAAASTLKIQPLKLSELAGASSLSSDFMDLPGSQSPTVVPVLWGLNGYATHTEASKEAQTWAQIFASKPPGGIDLKPSSLTLTSIAQAVLGVSATDAAILDRAHQISSQTNRQPGFFATSKEFDLERGAIELSHGESLAAPFAESDWVFRLPADGAALWILSVSLGGKAENAPGAKKFIEFLLLPATAVVMSQQTHQASCNKAVEASAKLAAGYKPSYLRTIPLERVKLADAKLIERAKLLH